MDEAITMFVSRMVPNGTWINTDSLIKAVESYILCQPTDTTSPTFSYHQRTDGSRSPSTVTVVHRLGEPMDGISSDEHSELEGYVEEIERRQNVLMIGGKRAQIYSAN